MKRKLQKADWIVFGVLALICGILLLFFFRMRAVAGDMVTITVDGEVYGRYSLEEDQEIFIKKENEICNVVSIKDGKAYMKEADCPDQLCRKQGKISSDHASIVCLPNRVVVEISSEEESALDGVAG